jgi:hypothetical protein
MLENAYEYIDALCRGRKGLRYRATEKYLLKYAVPETKFKSRNSDKNDEMTMKLFFKW